MKAGGGASALIGFKRMGLRVDEEKGEEEAANDNGGGGVGIGNSNEGARHHHHTLGKRAREDWDGSEGGSLPPGWSAVPDPASGCKYYWNKATGEVSWDMPR